MGKIFILSLLCFILLGCSQIRQNNANWQTYNNFDLGVSFQYPSTLGKAVEYKDVNGKLTVVRLQGKKNLPGDLEFGPAEYNTLRTCNDVLANGFPGKEITYPSKCETISNSSNVTLEILEFQDPTGAKVIDFQTNNGVWSFGTQNKTQYDLVVSIAKTVKYLR